MKISIAVLLVAFFAHIYSGHVKAEKYLPDDKTCPVAVNYAMQFMTSTNPQEIHAGVWSIINNEVLDDAQMLITIVTFHSIQQVAWQVNGTKVDDANEVKKFWDTVKGRVEEECNFALNKIRFPDA